MVTITTIRKWGKSLVLAIPDDLAKKHRLFIGQRVELAVANGRLTIRPIRRASRYKLSDLLKSCKGKPHPDIWPDRVGKELI